MSYSFRIHLTGSQTALHTFICSVHCHQSIGYKINTSCSFILRHKLLQRLRYFHASVNNFSILGTPCTIQSMGQINILMDECLNMTLDDMSLRAHPTLGVSVTMTNVALRVYHTQCMITREEAQAKFREYHDAQGPHDQVYTDGSKIDERVGAAAVINRHFQNGESTCHQLSKRLPNNSTIFAAEATAITLALKHYRHMDPYLYSTMSYSTLTQCLACRQLTTKILTTLLFARSRISSGHWVTKALLSASAGCQATVA